MAEERPYVLIVEDDPIVAADLVSTIEKLGFAAIGAASNLDDGLRLAETAELSYALLDVDLGNGTDTMPIAEKLRERGVPFAFTTALSQQEMAPKMSDAPVLWKPVSRKELERVLLPQPEPV